MDGDHRTDAALREYLERAASLRGGTVAVEPVDGHWRAGFIAPDELGEPVYLLSASGPDADTALRELARLASDVHGGAP